jgi:hypothetical protein
LNDRPTASGTRLGGFERLAHTIFVFHQFLSELPSQCLTSG